MRQKLVILAGATDLHSDAVAWALRQMDFPATICSLEDFPARLGISLSPGQFVEFGRGDRTLVESGDGAVVWRRRLFMPSLSPKLHPADIEVAKHECRDFTGDLLHLMSGAGFRWINPNAAAWAARSKSLQLMKARGAGFAIPRTLVSNDPARILEFCDDCGGTLAVKSYVPHVWDAPASRVSFTAATALVTKAQLQFESATLANCPAIYQEYIDKAFELRITVFDDQIHAVKIDSQVNGPTVDWRYDRDPAGNWPAEEFDLPAHAASRVAALMKSMDLLFGCIDVIVTADGEYVFLEVNEQGQFLWIEEQLEESALLSRFCRMVVKQSGRDDWNSLGRVSFEDYLASSDHADFRTRLAASSGVDDGLVTIE